MKLKIRFATYSLLAGIMVLINSCKEKDPELKLLSSQLLPYFSSASAIECYNSQLYIFGDDASYLLVLDTNYAIVDSTTYFADTAHRIAKEIKPDIEAATLLDFGDRTYLYGFGSMSTKNRKMVYSFPIDSLRGFIILSCFNNSEFKRQQCF